MVEPHPDDSRLTQPMDRWWLARHLGMLHKQRNRVLDRAVDQAAQWFSAHGGELKLVAAPDGDEAKDRVSIHKAEGATEEIIYGS